MNFNNTFYKTFTGTDTLAFMIFPSCKPILLGSLTTLSYSIYREKKPVPLIGKINTGGFTRGMRSVAGSMIFTLVNQHFVKDVVEQVPYLRQHGKIKADELPFFDIMLVSSNEYGAATQMMIYGLEIIEEGQVVSIQDIYIENTFTFVARDVDEFTRFNSLEGSSYSPRNNTRIDTIAPYQFTQEDFQRNVDSLQRDKIGSNELVAFQNLLQADGKISTVTGVLDDATLKAINAFQKEHNLPITNYLDNTTYDLMKKLGEAGTKLMSVANKNGAYVYDSLSKSNTIGLLKRNDVIVGKEFTREGTVRFDFNGNIGFLNINDTDNKDLVNYEFKDMVKSGEIIDTDYKNFNPTLIGTKFLSTADTELKLTAVSHYGERMKTFARYFDVEANTEFNAPMSALSDCYIFDLDMGAKPDYIEYFVFPIGGIPKKFMINLKG